MKIAISYFYQIRNFKKNMLPLSTACSDPGWYHNNLGPKHIFTDKRGIINGIRIEPLHPGIECQGLCGGREVCKQGNPKNCDFLLKYREQLEKINFNDLYSSMEALANRYSEIKQLEEEPVLVLIVYETPSNHCSERGVLINYFNSKGVECKELEYPIQKMEIKKGEFVF